MSLRRAFFAALAQQQASIVLPPGLSRPEAFRQRVLDDGGIFVSQQNVEEAYAKADAYGMPPERSHWSSPRFGFKLENGQITKRYCLFGHDAINSGPILWQIVPPSASGKPIQMNTQTAAFEFAGWTWPDKKLTIHVLATPTAFSNSNAPYPYFPIVEQGLANSKTNFLIAFEQGQGFEAGHVSPDASLITDGGHFPPLNQMQALMLRIDPAQVTAAAQRRAWMSGRELTAQGQQGLLGPGGYPEAPILLGSRFETPYAFVGNINDVLVTNALLPDAARAWLDSQKNAY